MSNYDDYDPSDFGYDGGDPFSGLSFVVRVFSSQILKVIVFYSTKTWFNPKNMYKLANNVSLETWKRRAMGATTSSGGLLALASYLGMAVDLFVIVDAWFRTSMGIGCIIAKARGYSYTDIERRDFTGVLAYWCGAPKFAHSEDAKKSFETGRYSFSVGNFAAQKVSAKGATKLAAKFVGKFVTKLSTKLAAKLTAGIPMVGMGANAAINGIFMSEICQAAEDYFTRKFDYLDENKVA